MDRSPKVESEIIKRIKARDAAREGLRNSKAAQNEAWSQARRAENAAWKNNNLARDLSNFVEAQKLNAFLGGGAGYMFHAVPDVTNLIEE